LAGLTSANPGVLPAEVLLATQRLMDRVLFIAFAEDRGLVPVDSLAKAFEHKDPYNPRPTWENFTGLFRAIDQGSAGLGIPRYNGGLFAPYAPLDSGLVVPDAVCKLLKDLGDYNYGTPAPDAGEPDDAAPIVDVEILGHIFEQSIEDLEAIRAELEGGIAARRTSRRKREGAFYTPQTITRYLVAQALDPVLADRFERLRVQHVARATGTQPRVLADPAVYDPAQLNAPQRDALVQFWEGWLADLGTVRVLDPACGSGAFLIEAFDQLHGQYADAVERLADLRRSDDWSLFDPDRTILQQNLFGVDLNAEAVEIARLSVWIKTAQRGKVLADLDHTIRVGNSVVNDAAVDARALDWTAAFPEVFAQDGFDVVVGNPPYVRGDHLAEFKSHFTERYETAHGSADLYVYFFEQGLRLLRPGGYLAYIVTNKWLKAEYAEPLRRYLAESTWLEQVIDLGHARQVFPDADVFPSILRLRAPLAGVEASSPIAVSVIPREGLELGRLIEQVKAHSFDVPRETLTAGPWLLDPPAVRALLQKMQRTGEPLADYLGADPLRGVMTGYNDAFLLTTAERDALVAADRGTEQLFKPYVRGQDIARWAAEWDGRWLLALRSSSDHSWPWRDAGEGAEAVFERTYPALYRHMRGHEDRLRRRTDQGRYWWELRSCSYYELFDRPKLLYQEIQFYPAYALDTQGLYTNNKGFFLPTEDLYLLGVLNSPLMWWHNWRFLAHMKDEALNPSAVRLRQVPIARPTDQVCEQVSVAVSELLTSTAERRQAVQQLHDWLRAEFGVEKFGDKLSVPDELTFEAFVGEVKARRSVRKGLTSAELRRLRDEYNVAVPTLQAGRTSTQELERVVALAVNEAYGLTAEEVELLWRLAPPRMPGASPA
jgi:Eco57I restriction-modification methylase/TaqI-like C-terminal specificity domain